MRKNSKAYCLFLDKDKYILLQEYCNERKITTSELINKFIEELLKNNK